MGVGWSVSEVDTEYCKYRGSNLSKREGSLTASIVHFAAGFPYLTYVTLSRPLWLFLHRWFAQLSFGHIWEGSNYPSRSCNGPNGPKGPKFTQNIFSKIFAKNGFYSPAAGQTVFANILLVLWSLRCIHWSKWSPRRCAFTGCSFIQQFFKIRLVDGKIDRSLVMNISTAGHRMDLSPCEDRMEIGSTLSELLASQKPGHGSGRSTQIFRRTTEELASLVNHKLICVTLF